MALGGTLPGGPPAPRTCAAGEETGDGGRPSDRVARWLDDLGSDLYAVREEARRQLRRRGRAVRAALEARRDDADPEIRRAVRVLLDRLGGGERATVAAALPGDLEGLGRLNLVLPEPKPLGAVLARVGEPFGATFHLPEGWPETRVRIQADGVAIFRALSLLAEEAGLSPRGRFDASGTLTLVPGGMEQPWAAAGPLRVRVTEVTTTRTLGGTSPRRRVLTMEIDWPPAFQVVSWQTPVEVEGTDGEGGRYRAAPASLRKTTYGVGATSPGGRFELHLEGGGDGPDRLARLTFRLPLRLRHARRTLRFEAPFDDLPRKRAVVGGGEVTLESVTEPPDGRGPWGARVVARLRGEIASSSLQIWFGTADGRRTVGRIGSRFPSSDERLELSARANLGRDGERPTALVLIWFEQEDHGSLPFALHDVPLR